MNPLCPAGPETLVRSCQIFRESCEHRHGLEETGGGNGAMFQYGPRAGFRPYREQGRKKRKEGLLDNLLVPFKENSFIVKFTFLCY